MKDEPFTKFKGFLMGLIGNGNTNLSRFAHASSSNEDAQKYFTERDHLLKVLNHFEFIAAGIRERTFDACLYWRMQCSVVVKIGESLESFIVEIRKTKSQPTLFQEFEWMAKEFRKKPLKKS